MKLAEALALQAAAKKKKGKDRYKAKKMELDGLVFHSKSEAKRYATLQLMQRQGEIRNLTCQNVYSFDLNGVHIATYTSDFEYEERTYRGLANELIQWNKVVEDFKSNGTKRQRDWPRTKKLMLAFHGITIREIVG